MVATDTKAGTITATLVRHRTYFYKNVQYLRGVEVVVSEELANELEALGDEVFDTDGESMFKASFKIKRGASSTSSEDSSTVSRLKARATRRRV